MYIPITFFTNVGDNACVIAQGGNEIGTFQSGSSIYKYHKFTTTGSASFTVTDGALSNAQLFIIGGGGGGGYTTSTDGGTLPAVAAGGGAGGLFFANNLIIAPGVYNLFVGSGSAANGNGQNTWFETNQIFTTSGSYYPTDADKITALGGGFGGYASPTGSAVGSGGSGGGGIKTLTRNAGRQIRNPGSGLAGQGFEGGALTGPDGVIQGTGGGGAGAPGEPASPLGADSTSAGGAGKLFNLDGTPQYYAGGGGGVIRRGSPATNTFATGGVGSQNYGGAGNGSHNYIGGDPVQGGVKLSQGKNGVVVIVYPLCNTALDCTQYIVDGGVSGGLFNYVPCGTTSPVSFSVDSGSSFFNENAICATNVPGYPTSTGTVSFASTGSCSTYIVPINTPTCSSGSVIEPVYIYNWTVTGSNTDLPYPAQPVVEIAYKNIYSQDVVEYYNNPYGNETSGQIRAIQSPTPTIQIVTGTGTTSMTQGAIAGLYCANEIGRAWEIEVSKRFSDGANASFWYVNTSGSIVNDTANSTTPRTIISQTTNLSIGESDPIGYQNNLVSTIIRPLNVETIPYPYSGSYRNYKVTLQQYTTSGYYNTYYNIVYSPSPNTSADVSWAYLWGQQGGSPSIAPYDGKPTYVNSYSLPYQEYRAFSYIEDMGSVISGSCLRYNVFDNRSGLDKTYRYKNCAGNSITASISNTSASVCVFPDTFISGGNSVSIIPLNTICT